MPRMAKVKVTNQHYDKTVQGTRPKGAEFIIPRDSAMRRERANLVKIVEEYSEAEYQAMREAELRAELGIEDEDEEVEEEEAAEEPDIDEFVNVEVEDEDEDVEKTPEDLVIRRSNSSWYDVEGYDDNPVQGKEAALEIAKEILDA